MKIAVPKNLFLNNTSLKFISLLLGYSFWYIASYDHIVTFQLSVPLCFSPDTVHYHINAPEKIDITIRAKRSDLYALEKTSLAAHINTNKLLPGKHGIIINEQHLFLPRNITLINYKPSNLTLTILEKRNNRNIDGS